MVKNCKSEGPLMAGLSVLHFQMTSTGWVASALDHSKDDIFLRDMLYVGENGSKGV